MAGTSFALSDIRRVSDAFSYLRLVQNPDYTEDAADVLESVLESAAKMATFSDPDSGFRNYVWSICRDLAKDYPKFPAVMRSAKGAFANICATASRSESPSGAIAEALYEIGSMAEPESVQDKQEWLIEFWSDIAYAKGLESKGSNEFQGFTPLQSIALIFQDYEKARLD